MARNTRPRDLWSPEMRQRVHALWKDGVSAAQIAKLMNAEFSVTLTRSAILGRLYRDRVASDAEQVPRKRTAPAPRPKKDAWRKDDERWNTALTMRRRGHKWPFVAAHLKIPVADLKARLREIADADIREGGKREEWGYVLDLPPPPGDYGFE